jgi:hypothetical protein
MKLQLAAGIVALSMIGGVGTGVAVHKIRTTPAADEVTTKPTVTATTTKATKNPPAKAPVSTGGGTAPKPSTPTSLPVIPVGSMRITAGAVGPVSVGMTKLAAYATGYFNTDVEVPACNRVEDLAWKPAYANVLDVLTHDDGSVSSIGVRAAGPRTRSGLGVGSTYEAVQGVLGNVAPVAAGQGQTGLFISEGTGWIGFLFNAAPDAVAPTSPVTFIEVTRGAKPGLIRDGC